MKTKIALIGRPNVGKSALFNRIMGRSISIVGEREGITRDRLYGRVEAFGRSFEIIDTGGIDAGGHIPFADEVRVQAEIAMEEANSLIMVVDGKVGVTTLDEYIAALLLRGGKPLILAINKVEDDRGEMAMIPFYALGIKTMLPISAIHGNNIAELLELIGSLCPGEGGEEVLGVGIKVAIIGRPNVGKSTMINTLFGEERCIISPVAGTTRDLVDVPIEYEGEIFTFIDTAGIRRKKSERDVVDKFAFIRSERAIERADICMLMIDARDGITTQEKHIAHMIERRGKGVLIFCNKWDCIKGTRMEHCRRRLEDEAPFLNFCPKLFGSALVGTNAIKIFPHVREIYGYLQKRIATGELNTFVASAVRNVPPPVIKGRRLRIYYMAQVDNHPPRFVFFVNHPDRLAEAYKKYLINQFRITYKFSGAPLIFHFKGKRGTGSHL